MAANQVSIYNMAIGMIGGIRIMSLADDVNGSVECALLNEIWPTAVDDVIASRDWSFARTTKLLVPVPDPLAYSGQDRPCYARPIDCATLRKIDDSATFDGDGYEWEIEQDIIIVHSSVAGNLWAKYTRIDRDTATFDGSFVACLVARLAMELALPIAESKSMFKALSDLYDMRLKASTTINAMQGKRTPFAAGKLSRARNI